MDWEENYKTVALPIIKRIESQVPSLDLRGKRVLDIGCWWGWFIRYSRNQGASVTGFDCSKNRLVDAIEFLQGINGLCIASAERIPYESSSFDVVFSYHVMEHVQLDSVMLREINRVLKNNGILILAVPNDFSLGILPFRPFRWLLRHKSDFLYRHRRYDWLKSIAYSDTSHYREYTVRSLANLLSAGNFSIVSIKSYGFEFPYPLRGRMKKNVRILMNRLLGPLLPPFFRSEFIVHATKPA